ncbi:MAG TPA: type II toxin-antitoxin system prevent-host-death family antitoxin [Terriglobia bacterium]|nr:type II toxin-antitoxin system prevent-host-death family antitoxin [Terriglobia bacterium]
MGTRSVGVREARQHFRRLLDKVQAGDEIIVLRRGVEVGRLVQPKRKHVRLPDLTAFRASVKGQGETTVRSGKWIISLEILP